MGKYAKLLQRILTGASDESIDFQALCQLLVRLDFDERIRGSHHIFTRPDIHEIMDLPPKVGKAKAYQVKQVRGILVNYRLGESNVD